MYQQFANVYWSGDIISGIQQLGQQSQRSITQIHDLQKLVFSYMNYYYANSEHLNRVGIDLHPQSSGFKPLTTVGDTSEISVEESFARFMNDITSESNLLANLSIAIERQVLENINNFIKYHESVVRQSVTDLNQLYTEYTETYARVAKLRDDYDEYVENESLRDKVSDMRVNESETDTNTKSDPQSLSTTSHSEESPSPDFSFPITIGTKVINDLSELRTLLADMKSHIPTIKRKIPIPGSKNEIFKSDNLNEYLRTTGVLGKVVTRSITERFGQALIDQKYMVGSGLWGSRVFKSEGMWFEWSSFTDYILGSDDTGVNDELEEAETSMIEESASAFVSNVVSNTSKLFKTVKSSINRGDHYEDLVEIQQLYESAYLQLQELKARLEQQITTKAQELETFEKSRIKLVYDSLTSLSRIIYNFSLSSTTRLHTFATHYAEIDPTTKIDKELEHLINTFSSGIYISGRAPESTTKSASANIVYQDIKLKFNLYIDIPLQVLVSQSNHDDDDSGLHLLSIKSIPLFLYELVKLIEVQADIQSVSLTESWSKPIDHHTYWSCKENAIKFINEYSSNLKDVIPTESSIHSELVTAIVPSLGTDVDKLVNFLKSWLLEISDSIIPCSIYDSLVGLYSNTDENSKQSDLLKYLGSTARSNLASLLFVLEHIAGVYDLTAISNYELSDTFEDLHSVDDTDKIRTIALDLNSMDAIGSIPFIHLIFRPPTSKSSKGFKPKLDIYQHILQDLLLISTRKRLFEVLVDKEKVNNQKKESERIQPIPKIEIIGPSGEAPRTPRTPSKNDPTNKPIPLSPAPLRVGEIFTPRPFRTGNTPNPSPRASPVHRSTGSISTTFIDVLKEETDK
ncbi:uncharacterized protein RJT21DRAFT_119483 [Scheffersomyces amazonensis]|uniref:uncharacterized protein n=1 Tax=Scheffersomyces amazonensis TaxID=1078765 RepID=UPI00315DB014